jgi:predicted RNA-binding protein YlqC (UPF0109 family)
MTDMTESTINLQALITQITKALVDDPEQVIVSEVDEGGETVLELEVAPADMGKVIGRQGRTVRAMRNLVSAAGMKAHKRYALEVLE